MTLYVVQAPGSDDDALVRARFVADGFSWPAFLFTWVWLLYRRLWLALLVWILVDVAFLALVLPHVSLVTAFLVELLARIALGLEAHRLRVAKGARRAVVTGLVEARDRDEAEAIFYARHGTVLPESAAPGIEA